MRKTLKSILKLSIRAPTAAVLFLTGELPMEGKIHLDIFSLFFSLWSNKDTKIYEIVSYLLEHSKERSQTWSNYLRYISDMYDMTDPLTSLRCDPPTKLSYKEYCMTKVTSFHERILRHQAKENPRMKYFNVSLSGLRGRPHPSITNAVTTSEVRKMRPHLKMLVGDYTTFKTRSEWSGGSPDCRLCASTMFGHSSQTKPPSDTVSHNDIVATCPCLATFRNPILNQMSALCNVSCYSINFTHLLENEELLTQFVLDPSSLNMETRININDPLLPEFFRLSRDLCYVLDRERGAMLKKLNI